MTLISYSWPEGRYHHPLNPLNPLNPGHEVAPCPLFFFLKME